MRHCTLGKFEDVLYPLLNCAFPEHEACAGHISVPGTMTNPWCMFIFEDLMPNRQVSRQYGNEKMNSATCSMDEPLGLKAE